MADLTFTTIEEPARAALEITRDDYALCNYIQTWSSHPGNKQPGYCDRTRQQMADFIGVTTRGIMKMLDRLERVGLVERLSEKRFLHRITMRWFDTVSLAKAERKGEQSSPLKENKVPPHKDIYKESKDFNKEAKKAGNPLCPPFQKIAEIELPENFSLAANPSQPTSPGGGGPGAILVSITGPEHPEITVHDIIEPKTEPVKTGRSKTKNPRTNEPKIHPENEQAFQHFNDPAKARAAWAQWIKYKFEQFRDKYKSGDSELICLRKHWKDTNGDAAAFEKNISHSIGSLYKGIFPPKEEKTHGTNGQPNGLNAATRQHLNLAKGTYERWQRAFNGDAPTVDYITGAK